jgi:acid stress-induced BolA-like protein IbaG/YrbA
MESIESLAENVKAILKEAFAPAEIGLSTRDGIVIWVVSDLFEGMDDLDRQEAIWNLLEKTLNRDERRAVSIVVALTPKEREFHKAGSV